uniref:Uncharacterized protein n=1 Tax=Cacopsylla melanoneura TaxID=428564 RepID=A0A8D9FFV6_9HEMI
MTPPVYDVIRHHLISLINAFSLVNKITPPISKLCPPHTLEFFFFFFLYFKNIIEMILNGNYSKNIRSLINNRYLELHMLTQYENGKNFSINTYYHLNAK